MMKIMSVVDRLAARPLRVWLLVFGYNIAAGLFIQFILLPILVPAWHGGNGLFIGLDGPRFHRIALDLAGQIMQEGWGAWRPQPEGQFVAGMAALFYVLIYPAPWSLLPLNAALAATGVVVMIRMLDRFVEVPRHSLLAALPLMFFPSALLWNAQLHNENYAVPGAVFVLYGLTVAAELPGQAHKTLLVKAALIAALGALLVGLVRPQALNTLLVLAGAAAFGIVLWDVLNVMFGRAERSWWIRRAASLALMVAVLGLVSAALDFSPATLSEIAEGISDPAAEAGQAVEDVGRQREPWWKPTWWLPEYVDDNLKELARRRRYGIIGRPTDSNRSVLDIDVSFTSAGDWIAYQPRALQIGLFSPFPNIWFGPAQKVTGGAARLAAAFEMLIAYAAIAGLPAFIWRNRRPGAGWMWLFVCLGMVTILASATPNQGTLYRFRYPYHLSIVAMGVVGWLEVLAGRAAVPKESSSG